MSEENIKLLKKAGLKITEPRLTILALMQEHKNEHFSAEEVYKILLEQGSILLTEVTTTALVAVQCIVSDQLDRKSVV